MLTFLVGMLALAAVVIVGAAWWALRDGSAEPRRRARFDAELRELLDAGGRP